MRFRLHSGNFEAILDHFQREGFVVLTDVDPRIAAAFRTLITAFTGWSDKDIRESFEGQTASLTREARAALARPETTPELRALLLAELGELMVHLLGPIIHISHTFHPQIKTGAERGYILEGYSGTGLEVEAQYGFHQDFTAGRVLTSPSAIVCWVPLNTCERNALRLYRKSHTKGILANGWLPPDAQGMDRLGEWVDITAQEGQLLLFNFLVLHGGVHPGPKLRVSCDVRFFPFMGNLGSTPMILRQQPLEWIRKRLLSIRAETLGAPLCEASAFLGEPVNWPNPSAHSVVHWARYIEGAVAGDPGRMREAITRFANPEEGFDQLSTYLERFARLPFEQEPYRAVLPHLAAEERRRCEGVLARAGLAA
ncbi:MAG: phytanoyl-CoA dioxygenase family protein [Nitrospira sp.]|nr:phytanoyl-CoA dioxygenase family protein [Nitrospira sp.]